MSWPKPSPAYRGSYSYISPIGIGGGTGGMLSIFTFLNTPHTPQVRWLLTTYAGLDNQQMKTLRKQPSRWVCVRKLYPPLYVTDGVCALLNAE